LIDLVRVAIQVASASQNSRGKRANCQFSSRLWRIAYHPHRLPSDMTNTISTNVQVPLDNANWPYFGSRWWKFDFHTHTPASIDSEWAKSGTELNPREWLLAYMSAEIDCVAITDHNTGEWIDRLKSAYEQMETEAKSGNPPEGFRKLAIFPGVEISVHDGFHLLAIFDPSKSSKEIEKLLWDVGYNGTSGDSDSVTRLSGTEVIKVIHDAGGVPIPAHADKPGPSGKALLAVEAGTRRSVLNSNSIRRIFEDNDILAIEWLDLSNEVPECVSSNADRWARVLGSDSHSFHGDNAPGSRFTWVKMAKPTLQGLKLALLDGNGVSIRRSDEGNFDPFATPATFITRIEIENGRYIGNGDPACLDLTPLYNGLIGGRGTGKSTVVHALRLAFDRGDDLASVGSKAECTRTFENFRKTVTGRTGEGALRDSSMIRVELVKDGTPFRLKWTPDSGTVVQERSGPGTEERWEESSSQAVNPDRFPIRILSQGQIAAMAGDGRRALLDVIDESAGTQELHQQLDQARNRFLTKSARLRELEGELQQEPEVERKLAEVGRKLETLERRQHAEVLGAYRRAVAQEQEIDRIREHIQTLISRIDDITLGISLEQPRDGLFAPPDDDDILQWITEIDQSIGRARSRVLQVSRDLQKEVQNRESAEGLATWEGRVQSAIREYNVLQADLREQGVADPDAFERLIRDRQDLDASLQRLQETKTERDELKLQMQQALEKVFEARAAITDRRESFLSEVLADNEFVRIDVVGFGFDAFVIERNLREILNIQGDRFEDDICDIEDGEPRGGLAYEIATAEDRAAALNEIRERLINVDDRFGGHFRNYLKRKLENVEFADHIRCWSPDDDLRIQYSRQGDGTDWQEISQGSQGQRSVALLAFLLSFGEEPIVLDQPEDDLDNQLIYDLIVQQILENKTRRQLTIATHNPNVLVNGDAEMVHVFAFGRGQCYIPTSGVLQDDDVRDRVCRVMEGGRDAFARRWARLGRDG